jgi:serine protease Do
MMAPGTSVKIDFVHKGEATSKTVSLAEMPNDRQASAEAGQTKNAAGKPRLGLNLAPANEVEGAGQKGLVVTGVDPNGPAAQRGLQPGDVILNVGGKAVANVGDVRAALEDAATSGKRSVLMQVKTADATKFVAVPLAKG